MCKVLVYDVKGKMAHFRDISTNSSQLTYSFPPRPTIMGMVGAILGLQIKEYIPLFEEKNCRIGVELLDEIRVISICVNEKTSSPNSDSGITQNQRYILRPVNKYVSYRIYFTIDDEKIYNKLKEALANKKFFYPVTLGLAGFLADVEYQGEFYIKEGNGEIENINISTIFEDNDKIIYKPFKEQNVRYDSIYVQYSHDINNVRKADKFKQYIIPLNKENIKGVALEKFHGKYFEINQEIKTWL